MIFKSILLISSFITVLAGCSQLPADTYVSLGQFTAISSFNVNNLAYEKIQNRDNYTKGEACYLVNLHSLAYISGPKDNLVQRAVDEAIRNGQQEGINGDFLVNARIEKKTVYQEKGWIFKTKERYECVFAEGDLVKLVNFQAHQVRLVE